MPDPTMESHNHYSEVFSDTDDKETSANIQKDNENGPQRSSTTTDLSLDNSPRPPKRRICRDDSTQDVGECDPATNGDDNDADRYDTDALEALI